MSRRLFSAVLCLAALALPSLPVLAADPTADQQSGLWSRDTLTGNWGGARDRLADAGVTVTLDYTGELLANLRGGIRTGSVYEGLLLGQVKFDLAKLVGWNGAVLHVSAYDYHGRGLTEGYVGSVLGVSGNEAPAPSARLYEAYLDQKLLGGLLAIRVGQFTLDGDGFAITRTADVFVGSTFGLPDNFTNDLPGGAATFPLSAPGVRLRLHASDGFELSAAVQSGDPSGGNGTTLPTESYPTGTVFSFSGGALGIAQATWRLHHGKKARGLPMTFKLGAWYHTGTRFGDQLLAANGLPQSDPAASATPLLHHGNWGVYGSAEAMLFRKPGTKDQGLSGFVLLAGSPPDQNLIDRYAHAGLTYEGLIPARPDDRTGIAFAYAHISRRAQALDRDMQALDPAMPVRDEEMMAEATYQVQLAPWWTAQPDAQFWFHPGGHVANDDGSVRRNAVVVGVRSDVTF